MGDAANGSEALSQATQLDPDLVILDIELPDIDGFVVTRQLKALPRPPLVVLLSIHSDDLFQATRCTGWVRWLCRKSSRLARSFYPLYKNF